MNIKFLKGGFRASLQEATRQIDETETHENNNTDSNIINNSLGIDWSVHSVEYDAFKRKLRHFAKRRSRIRRKLAASGNDCMPSDQLDRMLGPPPEAVTRADVQAMMLPTPMNMYPYRVAALTHQQHQNNTVSPSGTVFSTSSDRHHHFPPFSFGSRIPSDTDLKLPGRGNRSNKHDRGDHLLDQHRTETVQNRRSQPPLPLSIPEEINSQEDDNGTMAVEAPYITMTEDDDEYDDEDELQDEEEIDDEFRLTGQSPSIHPSNPPLASSFTANLSMPHIFSFGGSAPRPLQRRSIMRHVSNWERNDLVSFLSMEMDKVAMFYLSQWQRLSNTYMGLTRGGYYHNENNTVHDHCNDSSPLEEDEIIMNRSFVVQLGEEATGVATDADWNDAKKQEFTLWMRLGKDILELQAFCIINIVAVRQMLIRYDAFARTNEGTPMMQYYMKLIKSTRSATSFRKILQHEEVLALGDSFLQQLQEKHRASETNWNKENKETRIAMLWANMAKQFRKEQAVLQAVVASSENAEATSSSGHAPLKDTLLDSLRYYFILGMLEDRLGYEPSYLTTRGRSLTSEMRQLAQWRRSCRKQWTDSVMLDPKNATKLKTKMFMGCLITSQYSEEEVWQENECDTDEPVKQLSKDTQENETEEPVSRQQKFNLFMALTAGFFYCMNYYIVEPSSTMYVNALGAQDAMSATLIGMMPIASFLSAIAYSIWTNHSFRRPFLVSCILMLVGNVIYSTAYNFKSLPMALAGRFMSGLGGPKCIIRRYMADTTSLSIRTTVNAFFGMVVAAGSALGPGCAILLNRLNFSIEFPWLGMKIVVNGMTGPGWFMASLWTLFLLALACGFKEQDRIGLEEQMQKESNAQEAKDELQQQQQRNEEYQNYHEQNHHNLNDDDLMTIMSGKSSASFDHSFYGHIHPEGEESLWKECQRVSKLLTFPVRICLGLLFAKVFVIETLVSCTSSLSKNRYGWTIQKVGLLGLANGLCVIPLSIMVGKASMLYQDRALMLCLLSVGVLGMSLLIDYYDLFNWNAKVLHHSVGPGQYIAGYFITYVSIQSFEGVIGSALSKVIPTALATGTFNSGLLATLVDTFGRSCGDLFISAMGMINIDQLMNLLFIPGVFILFTCLFVVRKYYDLLAV